MLLWHVFTLTSVYYVDFLITLKVFFFFLIIVVIPADQSVANIIHKKYRIDTVKYLQKFA